MSLNLTSLPAYVDAQRVPLIAKSVFGSKTAKLISNQLGVKGESNLNLLNTAVYFGNGTCGWADSGSTSLTVRKITAAPIKVNLSFCDKSFLKTWGEYEVKTAAGMEVLPFEQYFTEDVMSNISANLETAIWQGATGSTNANLNKFSGFIELLAGAGITFVSGLTSINKTNVVSIVDSIFVALPAAIKSKNDLAIFCGTDTFSLYALALRDANLYNYAVNLVDGVELVIPATNVRLIAVDGLNGTNKLYGGQLSNFFYGTDLQNGEEEVKIWYSEDNSEFRMKVYFTAGVQVAFPDQIIGYKNA